MKYSRLASRLSSFLRTPTVVLSKRGTFSSFRRIFVNFEPARSLMTEAHQRPAAVVPLGKLKITLTEKEQNLRRLLLDVARAIDASKEVDQPLELRFAGGWVRDKLLGIPSHDIDTAINSMTGYAFTLKMREFLDNPDNLQRHGAVEDFGNLHKILANPEKSKHLETATTRVFGYDVDFVNLRSEVYSEDSRNPQMEFGTAREDALRRDATINALFYNLHTDSIEDFTTGLADLDKRIIRTPLEPRQTFLDDPLRVLRLIRFASRLDFTVESQTEEYMSEPAILHALKIKISRERVGVEVEKMLKDKNPRLALARFNQLGLFSTVFSAPQDQRVSEADTANWSFAYDCLNALASDTSPESIFNCLVGSDEDRYLSWMLAALAPWYTVAPIESQGKPPVWDVTLALRVGLKSSARVSDIVTAAFRNRDEIASWKAAVMEARPETMERDKLGMAIRRWEGREFHWKTQVLLAVMVEAMESQSTDHATLAGSWLKFVDHLKDLDLMEVHTLKRLVDGKELAKALDAPPGKWMAPALDVCLEWQLRNVNKSDPAGAIEEVRNRREELGIPLKKQKIVK